MSTVHPTHEENVIPIIEIQPINTTDPQSSHNTVLHETATYNCVPMNMNELFKHCFICNKYIGEMVDIYIYMSMPFCSNECRSNKMDKDDEGKPKISVNSKKRSRKEDTPQRVIVPKSDK
ncbi:hypothetical protein QVD17_25949 [Tagetes erecta]|uniref:FLZ-type domain-containing protein n=1 Tax=Tagetes erecta TaxID=13708 RepID=A0AAD8KA00_TARER|nr:hypothetical protein QVD17_25949 [Tagetes erecta]